MTQRERPSRPISATELPAQLQKDPEYQRKTRAAEAERQERVQGLRLAEQPIVAELRDAGLEVNSVWDLVNTSRPYPEALPILLRHLELGGYPDRVMESLGRALAVKPAVAVWDTLRHLYLAAKGRGETEGLAVALAASATRDQFEGLVGLLGEPSRGSTRVHFLRPIKRVGGAEGRRVLESLRADSTFGKEATALLGRSRPE
jgi:hypothetical protein